MLVDLESAISGRYFRVIEVTVTSVGVVGVVAAAVEGTGPARRIGRPRTLVARGAILCQPTFGCLAALVKVWEMR